MKSVLIAGASGMIGKLILEQCLRSPQVKQCTTIVRKPSGTAHPKLVEVIHQDFENFSNIKETFKNQDVAYYCVGVYTGAVPDDQFKKITFDYTKSFGNSLCQNSDKSNFVFLSGQGADRTETSSMIFAREKGKAENYLDRLKFQKLHIFRPGYIYSVENREEPNLTTQHH